jgi:hypothetical protein
MLAIGCSDQSFSPEAFQPRISGFPDRRRRGIRAAMQTATIQFRSIGYSTYLRAYTTG